MDQEMTQPLVRVLDRLEHIVKQARAQYDCRTLDVTYAILEEMIESYAQRNAIHSGDLGSFRNTAVRQIAMRLNTLQEKYTFQDAYHVAYTVLKIQPNAGDRKPGCEGLP